MRRKKEASKVIFIKQCSIKGTFDSLVNNVMIKLLKVEKAGEEWPCLQEI